MEPPNRIQSAIQTEKLREAQRRREETHPVDAGSGPSAANTAPGVPGKAPFGGGWKAITAGLAVVAGVALGIFYFQGSSADQPPSTQQEARIEAAFAAATPIQVPTIPIAGIAAAVHGMGGPGWTDERKSALQADAEAHRVALVSLTFWDTQAEDGDVVQVESPGYPPVTVPLKHAKTTVVLPAPASGSLTVLGTIDGAGGGITVGILSGGNPLDLPYLVPGQQISVPVKPGP